MTVTEFRKKYDIPKQLAYSASFFAKTNGSDRQYEEEELRRATVLYIKRRMRTHVEQMHVLKDAFEAVKTRKPD